MAVLMEMGVSLTPPHQTAPKASALTLGLGSRDFEGGRGRYRLAPQPLPRATFRFTGDLLCIALPQGPHNTPLCPTPLGGAVSGRRPLSIALTVLYVSWSRPCLAAVAASTLPPLISLALALEMSLRERSGGGQGQGGSCILTGHI